MESKFFLQSKTILGALLTAIVAFAPIIGISFSADDAQLISAQIDGIIQAVGLLLVVWGRIVASGPLTTTVNTDTLSSHWVVGVLAVVLLLGGCSVQSVEGKSPTETVRITYDSLKPSLDIYYALPVCAPEVLGLCSKADVVAKLQQGDTLFLAALTTAESLAATSATDAELAKATAAAQNALRTLVTLYAIQALTKA